MTRTMLLTVCAVGLAHLGWSQTAPRPTPGVGPTVVVETVKGTFEFETYPEEAPKTVAHILALVKRGFYNGQRIHRVVPGFVIQMGDPQTRDVTKQASWGRGPAASSGQAIGVAEFSKKRTHGKKGTVSMAYAGDSNVANAATADSQFFVTLAPRPELNGKYVVFGQVTSGLDVLAKLQVGDVVRKATVK